MTCDHDATRASFAAFFGTTKLIGGQDLPGEGWVLMGNCVACDSTLTIPIAEPRGSALHGEIVVRRVRPDVADAAARAVPGQDVIDEPPPVRPTKAEQYILDEIARHGNAHHYATPELRAHVRALAYLCPACGARPTYSCSNDDPLANNCPERQAFVVPESETIDQHARRVIR